MPFDPELARYAHRLGRCVCQLRVLDSIKDNKHPTHVGLWEFPDTHPKANEGLFIVPRTALRALLRELGRDEALADPGQGSFR